MKQKRKNILYIFLIIITAFIFSLSLYLNHYFTSTNLEQLLYNVINITDTFNPNFMIENIETVATSFIILSISIILPLIVQKIFKMDYSINIKNKKIKIFPINIKKYSIVFLTISIILITIQLKVPSFIRYKLFTSDLYEKYYVPYNKENITFPKNKQNLIMIYVESLENSALSIEQGGTVKSSYIPRLEALAKDNINFSNNNAIGGFKQVNGATWTAAGIVAQTSGIPISMFTKNKKGKFLEGVTSLGEILEENGYKNYFMMGSDSRFGERDKYLLEHGNYHIYDYNYAIKNKYIPSDYYTWWGYEDIKLYEFAKKKIIEISSSNEPFNFSLLTADTHFFDGYTSDTCTPKYDSNYANSYYCTDIMLKSFIDWLREQKFYQNTTIIITGDHLTMRDDFYQVPKNYDRTIYNLFLNSRVEATNTKNRDFTSLDIYPTTLGALDVQIKGNRLGLGTNMFSDKKTLSEEIGYKKLNQELQKRSKYYSKEIIK